MSRKYYIYTELFLKHVWKPKREAANLAAIKKASSSANEDVASLLSSNAVDKIITAIELLASKMDSQMAALQQEIVSIDQKLHTTVSSLQSVNAQRAKRVDELEQAATERTSTVRTLKSTVERLQSKVCT